MVSILLSSQSWLPPLLTAGIVTAAIRASSDSVAKPDA